ncbi:MAG: PH domain-containing protein [Pseudomonadota bacterium]
MIKIPDPEMIFEDEKILYSTGYHWIYVARSSWPLLLTLVIGTIAWALLPYRVTSLMIMIALIASTTWIVMRVIETMVKRCFVTNRRLINRVGLTNRDTKYVTLDRIGGMFLDQSPMERFLGYGRVKLIVPLIEIQLPEYLSNPVAFRRALYGPAAAAAPSVPEDDDQAAVEHDRLAKEQAQDDGFGRDDDDDGFGSFKDAEETDGFEAFDFDESQDADAPEPIEIEPITEDHDSGFSDSEADASSETTDDGGAADGGDEN